MTIQYTTRLALPYPQAADTADVPRDIQALALALDGVAPVATGLLAARPAAGTAGRFYYATDTALLYFDLGASWLTVVALPTDTTLYRVSAGVLKTDGRVTAGPILSLTNQALAGVLADSAGKLTLVSASGPTIVLRVGVTTETTPRYQVQVDGKQLWGDGTLAADTNLYRSGADQLTTDDALVVAGRFTAQSVTDLLSAVHLAAASVIDWSGDTNLYRSGADALRTDDAFDVGGALTKGGVTVALSTDLTTHAALTGTAHIKATVTALPGSPVDGQECYYQSAAMVTAGIGPWHLRYRSGSASSYKWEFVGGSPLRDVVTTDQAAPTGAGASIDLATVGPAITAPLAGVYDYVASFGGYASGGQTVALEASLAVNGVTQAAPHNADATAVAGVGTGTSWHNRITITTAGHVAKLVYYRDAIGRNYRWRSLALQPVLVG